MEPDSQRPGALYDYAYLDRSRVNAYAAQLFDEGILTSTKTTGANKLGTIVEGKGNVVVVSGSARSTSESEDGLERNYDAAWSLPIDVFNKLQSENMIVEDLSNANFGNIVFVEGALSVLDIRMLREMYQPLLTMVSNGQLKEVENLANTQLELIAEQKKTATNTTRRNEIKSMEQGVKELLRKARADVEEVRSQANPLFEMVKLLPHALQATLTTDQARAWMTLDPMHMVTSPEDFALKHGSDIPGKWKAIVLLDAKPTLAGDAKAAVPGASENMIAGMRQMMDMVREQFGRPNEAYGVTPLAIYRVVESAPELECAS